MKLNQHRLQISPEGSCLSEIMLFITLFVLTRRWCGLLLMFLKTTINSSSHLCTFHFAVWSMTFFFGIFCFLQIFFAFHLLFPIVISESDGLFKNVKHLKNCRIRLLFLSMLSKTFLLLTTLLMSIFYAKKYV